MKKIITILLALMLTFSAVLPVFADESKVTYQNGAERFVFTPGSDKSPTDLFPDFKDVMPGDTLTQQITVKNTATDADRVRVYLRALGAEEGSEDFLSQLQLQVKASGGNTLFNAAADEAAQLKDWVYLGTLYPRGEVDLDVTLTVPVTLDSKYQNQIGYLEWEFKVDRINVDIPDSPITGGDSSGSTTPSGGTMEPSGDGSGSGSGSGEGQGGTPTDPVEPTPPSGILTVPVSGDENTIHVGVSVDGTTAVIKDIDMTALNSVIGHGVNTGVITFDFSVLEQYDFIYMVDTVVLPAEAIQMIADAVNDPNNDAKSLEILLFDGVSIEFDAQALVNKAAQADGLDITITVRRAVDEDLTDAQKKTVGDHIAYKVIVTSGGEPITNMGGLITIHAPYTLSKGERGENIVVYYVDPEGNTESCDTSYDGEKERVNWKTDHLSIYMIDYDGCCWICLWIVLAVCAIVLLLIVIYRRRRQKKNEN